MEKEREIKKLAHVIMGASKSEICRGRWQTGDPGRSLCDSLESEGSLEAKLLLPRGLNLCSEGLQLIK